MNILKKSFFHKNANKPKSIFFILSGIILLIISFILSLVLGSTKITINDLLNCMIYKNNSQFFKIIYYVRLPRSVAAMLAGMALSVSGIIIQAVLHNSLAAPNIIGVNSGAGFLCLLIMAILPSAYNLIPIAAILGALFACLLIYALAAKTGASRTTIIMSGVALSSILSAGMNTIKTLSPNTLYNSSDFLIGGFYGISFKTISYSWILIILGIIAAFFLSEIIDIMLLGDDTARSLGLNLSFYRFILLIIASILAGCAVSFSGLLGFVGLMVPHITRYFTGNDHRILIPTGMLFGGTFVLICDTISRCLFAPYELPVGIILSFLGGPFFLILILKVKRGVK